MPYAVKTKNILFYLMLFLSLFLFQKTQASQIYVNDISSADGVFFSVGINYSKLGLNSISPKLNLATTLIITTFGNQMFSKSDGYDTITGTKSVFSLSTNSFEGLKTISDNARAKSNLLISINAEVMALMVHEVLKKDGSTVNGISILKVVFENGIQESKKIKLTS